MNIVVFVKQVPNTTNIKIDPVTNTLVRAGVESILNPFDMYALEEAILLKEKLEGKVTCICMGPNQAEEVLREAVSIGADDIILLSDRKFAGSDTWATSLVLASAVKKLGDVDLIICGQQAIDGDTAQTGPGVAAHLGLPQVCFVRKIEEANAHQLVCQRLMEDGFDRIQVDLPALLSVVKEINTPRLPSLRGKKRAKTVELVVWNATDLGLEENEIGLNGSPTQVVNIFSPTHEKTGRKIQDEPDVLARYLVDTLKDLSSQG